jgi:hypothetical protein
LSQAALGDLDGDGGFEVFVHRNDGAGNFTNGLNPIAGASGVQDVVVWDVDGDLDLDLVVAQRRFGTTLLNDGNGALMGRPREPRSSPMMPSIE